MKQQIPFLLLIVLLTACNQDSIFFTISQEVAPLKPRIEGTPTNMVVFNYKAATPVLYVASGKLHWYAKGSDGSSWDSSEYSIPQPGGKIIGLAATQSYLYVLSLSGSGVDTTLQRIKTGETTWKAISAASKDNMGPIHAIYADSESDTLFVAARQDTSVKDTAYAVFFVRGDNSSLRHLKSEVGMLTGAVKSGNDYFLSTTGGIFWTMESHLDADPPVEPSQLEDAAGSDAAKNRRFMGMIQLEDSMIIAVDRGGILYKIVSGDDKFESLKNSDGSTVTLGNYATGALALWREETGDKKLLLAGVQGTLTNTTTSGYTHGYVEFELDSNGGFPPTVVRRNIENKNLLTVYSNDRYAATLGKHPINHLFQTPPEIDDKRILFAATQKNGLWSYRIRDGDPQWNAEE